MKIFCYHGVVKKLDEFDRFFPKNILVSRFKEQISFLKKNNRILSLAEFEDKWEKRKIRNDDAMIFFDDCYQSALNGAEILLKNRIPAIFAISSDLVEKGYSWTDDIEKILPKDFEVIVKFKKYFRSIPTDRISEKLKELTKFYKVNPRQIKQEKFKIMSWKEIGQIKSTGFDIVHHGHRHYPMSQFRTKKEILEDISENVKILKKKLKIVPHSFVYPFGKKDDYNEESKKIIMDFRFKFGFTTESKVINYKDPFVIPREMIF